MRYFAPIVFLELAVFEIDGEIRIFDNRFPAKTVYRTRSPRAFLARVAELHRDCDFGFIPIFTLCGVYTTPLIDKALSDETLAREISYTKDEKHQYITFDISGEQVTFAYGTEWRFCTCGSDEYNWLETEESQ